MVSLLAAVAAALLLPQATVEHVDYYPAGCVRTVKGAWSCYPAGVEVHTDAGYWAGGLDDLQLEPGDKVNVPWTGLKKEGN